MYHPMASGAAHPAVLSIKFGNALPADVDQRVREIGAEIDPSLQMRRVVPLSVFYDEARSAFQMMALAVGLVTGAVLLLSAAGVHAMMSFTIAQRTREIGIRSALGAQPRHLLLGIFRGAMRQLALGIAAGSLLSVGVFVAVGYRRPVREWAAVDCRRADGAGGVAGRDRAGAAGSCGSRRWRRCGPRGSAGLCARNHSCAQSLC